jgi:hypothetical protein
MVLLDQSCFKDFGFPSKWALIGVVGPARSTAPNNQPTMVLVMLQLAYGLDAMCSTKMGGWQSLDGLFVERKLREGSG